MIHPLNCKEVTTRLALGEIERYGWLDRLMIRFHLVICWICRKYERQLRVIGKAFALSLEQKRREADLSKLKARLIHQLGRP